MRYDDRVKNKIGVEVIRHPVGSDGTLNYRFTFNVSVDPLSLGDGFGDAFTDALKSAFADEAARLRGERGIDVAYGSSTGEPLPEVK